MTVAEPCVAAGANKAVFVAGPQLQLLSAVSRKTHGIAGDFDVDLPLDPPFGIESRGTTGNHTIVVTFSNALASGNAAVADGAGAVVATAVSGNTLTINLTGVAHAQVLTLSLTDVTDNFAQSLPNITITMQTLLGDANTDGAVNASDISLAKSQIGQSVTHSNFRSDVNADGEVNASDIAIIKARSGASLPSSEARGRMATSTVLGQHSQSLVFSGPTTINITTTTAFTLSADLTFSGYSSYGLSYWLEVNDALAPFLSITDVTYSTFVDPNQTTPNPAPFNSMIGATSGFMTENRDLGATVQIVEPQNAVPPGTYHITDVTFSLNAAAPPGTYTLRSTIIAPYVSEVTDTNFMDNVTPAGTFTFTIGAGPTPRPSSTAKPTPTPGLTPTPTPTPRPSSTPKH
jgi:hypothetical protein